MKIKTVWRKNVVNFDDQVNKLLAEGWKLVKREVLVDQQDLNESVLYAELILEEEAPEA